MALSCKSCRSGDREDMLRLGDAPASGAPFLYYDRAMRMLGCAHVLVVVAAIAACIPNQAIKRGDAAAARGDWRDAERAYRAAVDREPSNVEIGRKYADAKAKAIDQALRTAEACRVSNDPACVDRELQYALSLDPGHPRAASMRVEARGALARRALDEARRSFDSDNPLATWRALDEARRYGVPLEMAEEAARLDKESAAKAAARARSLLEQGRGQPSGTAVATFTRARELAAPAAARDASFQSLLDEINEANRKAIEAEVAERLSVGDAALAKGDFDVAASSYEAALRVSNDSRVQSRATYARNIANARAAIARRDFDGATAFLRAAIATQQDQGVAQALLEAVEIRVYRIRLESIEITATKPGTGSPWVGKPWWRDAAPVLASAATVWLSSGNITAGKAAYGATAAVANIPPENRPTLVATIDLPDGRQLKTRGEKGLYVVYGAELYVKTNQFDRRAVRISVHHKRSGGDESVAVANVPLGEIVAGKINGEALKSNAQALQQVIFAVAPAQAWQDGAFARAELQDQNDNRASARLTPRSGAVRVQLVSAQVTLAEGGDGDGSAPDPFFVIVHGNQQIFKSSTIQDNRNGRWAFSSSDLYLDPSDELQVKLTDADFAEDDQIATWTVPARTILKGNVTLTTPKGTAFSLVLQIRNDRPQ